MPAFTSRSANSVPELQVLQMGTFQCERGMMYGQREGPYSEESERCRMIAGSVCSVIGTG